MDFVALQTFCRAVEEGNLTAAAKSLHVTKSVASRRLQSLEEDLGTKLVHRTTRGVTATDAGTLLYERASHFLADIEDTKQTLACSDHNLVGSLRITGPNSFGDINLKTPIAAFLAEQPNLSVHLNLTDERVDIIGGGYDLGLRITSELSDSSLIAKKLAALRTLVVAAPAYLEKYGIPQKPEDLKNHECLFYSNVEAAKQWSFVGPRSTRSIRVKGRVSSNSGPMQLEVIKAGLAVGALPRFFLTDALEKGEVVEVLSDYPRPDTFLYALYPEKRLMPLKVRKLIDFLADWYSKPENIEDL